MFGAPSLAHLFSPLPWSRPLGLHSYQIGVLCKATNTPFYAVGESFKFVRLYPLSQSEMPPNRAKPLDGLPDGLNSISPRMDYT